ncbi:RPII140-upstream gene protein [Daktulosphaira vitifoliae]|uniref:RPII140-upstream gene protein n=1 Tax=Daktulosphaira vitifoliae TaxID=58002 RepID=UPI0021AA7291|nr:RPII140-upstream gene protein [Daktulosphaira vitifoliae]
MFRNVKLSYTRCFLPAILFKKNEYDVDGTEILNKTKVGGWQGVKDAFKNDEDGNPSADVISITSTITYSGLLGGLYGSFLYSKRAYEDFFAKNQATLFQNQFEAKSKLQSQVTLAMARGVIRWGTRVALFCGPFVTIVTVMNAYLNDISTFSYLTAGTIVGGIARIHIGVKGLVVGATFGGILGLLVGLITLLILKLSPLSMQELHEWQSQAQKDRDAFFIQESKQSVVFQYDQPAELLEHDKRIENIKSQENSSK